MKKLLITIFSFVIFGNTFAQGIYNNGANIVLTSGSNIYIDGGTSGNYVAAGASTIKGSAATGTLTLEGGFTNNSANSGFTTPNNTKVSFVGAGQIIGGSASTTFGNIEAAGGGTKQMNISIGANDVILTGQDLFINGFTLTIDGAISGTGFLLGNITSNLTLTSASAASTAIRMKQTSSSTRSLLNLTMSRTNGASLNDTIELVGALAISNGTFTTNGKLILISNTNGTASVSQISSGGISGNVIAQRYIPGGTDKRRWRFLSFPVNNSGSVPIYQLQDDIFITGSGTGFDACASCLPSLRTYTESTSGAASLGWTNPGANTTTISTGTGFEVFVRGSRALANPFLNWTTPDDVTLDFGGALNTGSVVKPLDFTNTGNTNADGFNLVGNPYASPIDWASVAGWTRTNMSPWMYIYSAKTGTYNYINTSGTTVGTDPDRSTIVPSGQAFFVKATSSGATMTFTEAVKTTSTPFNFFRGIQEPTLKVTLNFNNEKSDETLVIFNDSTTKNGTDIIEAVKFFNDKINLYTISADNAAMAVNYMPRPAIMDTIRLSVFDYDSTNVEVGTHQLRFDSLHTISKMGIYLIDQFTSTMINIRDQNTYNFDITSNASSYGNNRLKLVFDVTSGIENNSNLNNRLVLYPNPANEKIYISISDLNTENTTADISIKNSIGQEFINLKNQNITELKAIDISQIPSGIYIFSLISEGKSYVKKFIKK